MPDTLRKSERFLWCCFCRHAQATRHGLCEPCAKRKDALLRGFSVKPSIKLTRKV